MYEYIFINCSNVSSWKESEIYVGNMAVQINRNVRGNYLGTGESRRVTRVDG